MWTGANDFDRMFDAMDLFRSRLNRMFTDYDGPYGDDFSWRMVNGSPRTNFYDTGDAFELIAEVPGLARDDINIRIQGNYLELSGKRAPDAPKDYKAQRVERDVSSFTRSFTLPGEVDVDKIKAVLKDGLLSLVLPKAEAAKPKQISIG
jgi:HSP20 family protein